MAGMIVGFDHDDSSIFEEQFRFIQDARIPISMTGMLNAVPKTPLYKRLQEAGRLSPSRSATSSCSRTSFRQGMSREGALRGVRAPAPAPLRYRNYRRRVMQLILHKGKRRSRRSCVTSRQDIRIFLRVVCDCVLAASPRRAWMTVSLDPRDDAPPAAGDPGSRHARAHAQAPLRIHARHVPAARADRARDRLPGGAAAGGARNLAAPRVRLADRRGSGCPVPGITPAAFGAPRVELQAGAMQSMRCHRRVAPVPQIAPAPPEPSGRPRIANDLGVAPRARCFRYLLPRRALSSSASHGRATAAIPGTGHELGDRGRVTASRLVERATRPRHRHPLRRRSRSRIAGLRLGYFGEGLPRCDSPPGIGGRWVNPPDLGRAAPLRCSFVASCSRRAP